MGVQSCGNESILISGVLPWATFAISVVTLVFLIRYVRATDVIARQATLQVESLARPAIIVKVADRVDDDPIILNVGNGPAIEIDWKIERHVIPRS
jgi:hypothetical protein